VDLMKSKRNISAGDGRRPLRWMSWIKISNHGYFNNLRRNLPVILGVAFISHTAILGLWRPWCRSTWRSNTELVCSWNYLDLKRSSLPILIVLSMWALFYIYFLDPWSLLQVFCDLPPGESTFSPFCPPTCQLSTYRGHANQFFQNVVKRKQGPH
jgi:hypothetical protein